MLLSPDTLLRNRYSIVRLIAQGGMGAIYEAKDQHLGHTVALKQMMVSGAELERAFEREARILARLRHPGLPNVSDYFIESIGQFLVMEYIPGDDLKNLLEQQGGPIVVGLGLRRTRGRQLDRRGLGHPLGRRGSRGRAYA